MAKEKNAAEKLLDVWIPPQEAGEAIGFMATTFTFNATFFEEDCLSAFFSLESDPDSESLSYIIEREEKLSKLECAMVLVDQHHAKTNRNLRWDLMAMRTKGGIQHAKVMLLFWSNCIRIVIGSANLTLEGYRQNKEIFTFFDFRPEATVPVNVLKGILSFLEKLLQDCAKGSDEVIGRGRQLISKAKEALKIWHMTDHNSTKQGVHIFPVFTFPGSVSAIKQIKKIWNDHYSYNPDEIRIISPFYDSVQHPKLPAYEVNEYLLNKNGMVRYFCSGDRDHLDGGVTLKAPKYLWEINAGKSEFYYVPELTHENHYRPFHAKSMVLQRGNWILLMMGSGNFTAAGMATGNVSNYEANVVFITSASVNKSQYDLIKNCRPDGVYADVDSIKWLPVPQEDAEMSADLRPLPDFILSAEAEWVDGATIIRFRFDLKKQVDEFFVRTEEGKVIFTRNNLYDGIHGDYYDFLWASQTHQDESSGALPAGFEVVWSANHLISWLPLLVKDYNCLPPPAQLRELPLHILLQILTSAKPLHIVLRRFFKELNNPDEDEFSDNQIADPHKKVDTSGFLLQRTRKISYAFQAIKERLSLPNGTRNALQWKLYGPVGLEALVRAIKHDQMAGGLRLPEERFFFMSELLLELSSVEPKAGKNCLRPAEVKEEISRFIEVVAKEIFDDADLKHSWIKPYVKRAVSLAKNKSNLS